MGSHSSPCRAAVPPAEQGGVKGLQARVAIEPKAQPAYRELLKFLRTTNPTHHREPCCREPARRQGLLTRQDPRVHALDRTRKQSTAGLSEVAKIHAQMLEVDEAKTWVTGDFPAFLQFLRTL